MSGIVFLGSERTIAPELKKTVLCCMLLTEISWLSP